MSGGTVTSLGVELLDDDTLRLTLPGNTAGSQVPVGDLYFPGGSSFETPELTMDVTADGEGTLTASLVALQLDYDTNQTPTSVRASCGSPDPSTLGTVDILSLPAALPGPRLSIDDVTVAEGDVKTVKARFTVTLSEPVSKPVRVRYATVDGTASSVNRQDFRAKKGVLTIPRNKLSKSFNVIITKDLIPEPTETFSVLLSDPVNAAISDAIGIGTILDADPVVITIGDAVIQAGDSGTKKVSIPVQTSRASDGPVRAKFTTVDGTAQSTGSGRDFTSKSGRVTIRRVRHRP